MVEDPELVDRVGRLEQQVRALVMNSGRWERTERHIIRLGHDLISFSDDLAARDDGPSRQRARDLQAVARCLTGILAGRTDPLVHYRTPEV